LQGWGNEIDRMDATLDALKDGLVPTLASDDLDMLAVWESILGLPVRPPDASLIQRQTAIRTALLSLNAVTAASVLDLLQAQGAGFSITRDTPGVLQDTLTIRAAQGSFTAGIVETVARQVWPAHRLLLVHFAGGFTFDRSRLDIDTL
jgi:uncharacterized protein YmfQ (DUF2313 family)